MMMNNLAMMILLIIILLSFSKAQECSNNHSALSPAYVSRERNLLENPLDKSPAMNQLWYEKFELSQNTQDLVKELGQSIKSDMRITNEDQFLTSITSSGGLRRQRRIEISRKCLDRHTHDPHGFLRLCNECNVVYDHGPFWIPRFTNEIECSGDQTCLGYQGGCYKKSVSIKLTHRLFPWYTRYYSMGVGCCCSLHPNSWLQYLYQWMF